MLNLEQIRTEFPPQLSSNPRNFLREYLQYKILEVLFSNRLSAKLTFIGGTAVRIAYNSQRFSEDLGFDSKALSVTEFEKLMVELEKELTRLGYNTSLRIVTNDAFHAYIKFSEILYALNLSPLQSEKLHIRIDSVNQKVNYKPAMVTLDKFDVYKNIRVASGEVLLAMKLVTILKRKRAQGRDYFDASFLISRGFVPDSNFLESTLETKSIEDVRKLLLTHLDAVNLEALAHDMEPFLFKQDEKQRVLDFRQTVDKL